jgi:hypothetical protein
MPGQLTGTFNADFTAFYAAVDKATSKMADFGAGADKVGPRLNRMIDEFQGRKLVQEATLAAEAIERIGGVSMLTSEELQRVAAQASVAVTKMKNLGIEVPAGVQKIANELKPVEKDLLSINGLAEELGGTFAAALSVEAVVNFAENIGKSEQALVRLSKETQISIGDLQDITAATAEYGLSNDDLAKAINHVAAGLTGDESIARGIHAIGLSVEDLKGMDAKTMFLTIEQGLSKLSGNARELAAQEIFKKLGREMAGFADDAEGAMKRVANLPKLTDKEAKDLAAYADAWERFKKAVGTEQDSYLGKLVAGFQDVGNAMNNGVGFWRTTIALANDFSDTIATGGWFKLSHVIEAANEAQQRFKMNTADAKDVNLGLEAALDDEAAAAQFLDKVRTDSAKALEPWQKADLDALREMGQLNQQNADHIKVSADQFKQYTENIREAEEATKTLNELTVKLNADTDKLNRDTGKTIAGRTQTKNEQEIQGINDKRDAEIEKIKAEGEAAKEQLRQTHSESDQLIADIDSKTAAAIANATTQFGKLADGVGVDFKEINDHTFRQVVELADNARDTYIQALITPGVGRDELEKLKQKYRDAEDAIRDFGHATDDAKKKQEAMKGATEDLSKALMDQAKAAMTASHYSSGPAFTYDLSTAAGLSQFLTMNPDARVSAPAGYFKTHNLADAVLAGYITGGGFSQYQAQMGGATGLTAAPTSAPAAAPGPSSSPMMPPTPTAPMPPAPGAAAGKPATVNVNVSGVFDPSSAQKLGTTVSGAIATTLTGSRLLAGWS